MEDSPHLSLSHSPTLKDRRWVLLVACVVMAVTLIPYIFGVMLAGAHPSRASYSWLTYNFDDSCVYLSWIRQAADGHLLQRNLFTTAEQSGHQINLFFLALGGISRITHLAPITVWHIARLILGVAFLRAFWWLLELLVAESRARKAAFLLLCVSAGLGWLPGLWGDSGHSGPVDVWQPEAITFLSLYLNPLFIVSLVLMVGTIGWLVVAERTRSIRDALKAGFCGFLLGNIHTYDVITVTFVWGAYLIVRTIVSRRFDAQGWGRALIAAWLTMISTGYVFYLLRTEEVFAQRAAVATASGPLPMVLLGFGIVLPLAFGAFRKSTKVDFVNTGRDFNPAPDPATNPARNCRLLLVVWAVVNLAVAYIPVAFQRKMLMGEHLPLVILAGLALSRLPERTFRPALAAAVLATCITNVRFLARDMERVQGNRVQSGQRAYLYADETKALAWLQVNAPQGSVIQPLPWLAEAPDGRMAFYDTTLAALTPGMTGHPVAAGHWGETPDFAETMGKWRTFLVPSTPDSFRIELLNQTGVRYLIFSQKGRHSSVEIEPPKMFILDAPYLRRIPEASGEDADVYEVKT